MTSIIPSILILIVFFVFQIKSYQKAKGLMGIYRNVYPDDPDNLSVSADGGDAADIRIETLSDDVASNEYRETIFRRINSHIHGSGGQLDFDFVEVVMDETCEPLEHRIKSISSQPVYLGLMGTLTGVILGIFGLMVGGEEFGDAGIRRLLEGVTVAMGTSISGLIMLLAAGSAFERSRQEHALRRADFADWVQEELVPKLPRDTASVINKLVQGLKYFNSTFSSNVERLSDTLTHITESREQQLEVIEKTDALLNRAAALDVARMAANNIEVMKKLDESVARLDQSSTRIEHFNEYLSQVQDYARQLTDYQTRLNDHTENLADAYKVLREIYDFFSGYKGSIARTVDDADRVLDQALESLRETTRKQIESLNAGVSEETGKFADHLSKYGDQLSRTLQRISDPSETRVYEEIRPMRKQLDRLPEIETAIASLSETGKRIDVRLDALDRKVDGIGRSRSSQGGNVPSTGQMPPMGKNGLPVDTVPPTQNTGSGSIFTKWWHDIKGSIRYLQGKDN